MTGPELATLAVLLPLAGAVLIALAGAWPNLREGITLLNSRPPASSR